MTVFLFYGASAYRAAVDHAQRIGPAIHPALGVRVEKERTRYLNAEEARQVVTLLQSTPLFPPQTLVLGPVDMFSDKVCDALLKSLEEYTLVVPVLYAQDLAGVRNTILSRSLARYAPGEESHPDRTFFLRAAREGCWHDALPLLKEVRGNEIPFLKSLAYTVQCELEATPGDALLCSDWSKIRSLLDSDLPLSWPDVLQLTLHLKREG